MQLSTLVVLVFVVALGVLNFTSNKNAPSPELVPELLLEQHVANTSNTSDAHTQLLELHNQARQQSSLFADIRECDRPARLNSTPPLRWNKALSRAAQRQADWMAAQHTLSHGSALQRRAKSVGYGYQAIAENIAKINPSSSAERLMSLWVSSRAHCTNIYNADYRDIGIGSSNGYWAVILGREF